MTEKEVTRPSFTDTLAAVKAAASTGNVSVRCGIEPGLAFAEALFDAGGEVDSELMSKNTAMEAAVRWEGGLVAVYRTGAVTIEGGIIAALEKAEIGVPAGRRQTY